MDMDTIQDLYMNEDVKMFLNLLLYLYNNNNRLSQFNKANTKVFFPSKSSLTSPVCDPAGAAQACPVPAAGAEPLPHGCGEHVDPRTSEET